MSFSIAPRTVLLAALAAILLASAPSAHALGPNADIFFGYSRLGNNTFHTGAGSLNGWEGAMHLGVKHFVGIEGDVAQYGMGSSAATPHTTVVMGGPRVTFGGLGVHVFGHALVGVEQTTNSDGLSDSALSTALGAGGDVRFFPFLAFRVSADYLNTPTETQSGAAHERVSAGIVFRF